MRATELAPPQPKTQTQTALPLVSVIIAAYNAEKYIMSTIRSALRQDYSNFEIIVVNDGSTDSTLSMLQSIQDPRLTLLSQENKGVSAARNHAARYAKGEYFALLDADDLWFPNKLSTEVSVALKAPNPVALFYSNYHCIDEDNRYLHTSPRFTDSGNIFMTLLTQESVMNPSATLMHRDVFFGTGGFPETIRYHEDKVFFLMVSKLYPAYPIGTVTAAYRQSASGKGRRLLSNLAEARQKYSIVEISKTFMEPHEVELNRKLEVQYLFYKLMMNNYFSSAKTLYGEIDKSLLFQNKKGILAFFSMLLNINLLYRIKQIVQAVSKRQKADWWQKTSVGLFDESAI
jgi:glycosyltransferase involved in cell wall biosynthesis